jgi:hypothetical protein
VADCAVGDAVSPPDLREYALHCFSPAARRTPQSLVGLDTNGRILCAARRGASRAELDACGPTTESQLVLLELFGLLSQSGGIYRTLFPILDAETLREVEPAVNRAAEQAHAAIRDSVRAMGAMLRRQGFDGFGYAVVFGHAIDGRTWDELGRRGLLPPTELSIGEPWWRGTFWARYPRRADAAGTNEVRIGGGARLVMVWTEPVSGPLRDLERAAELVAHLRAMLEGSPPPAATLTDGAGRRWVLQRGQRPVIPVVRDGDEIDRHARIIARHVAIVVEQLAAGQGPPETDHPARTVILGHELIWELTHRLLANEDVDQPAALSTAAPTTEQLQELLFLHAPH